MILTKSILCSSVPPQFPAFLKSGNKSVRFAATANHLYQPLEWGPGDPLGVEPQGPGAHRPHARGWQRPLHSHTYTDSFTGAKPILKVCWSHDLLHKGQVPCGRPGSSSLWAAAAAFGRPKCYWKVNPNFLLTKY